MKAYGKKTWLIPDTFLNSVSKNTGISHEAAELEAFRSIYS